jgi:hypothetical protein
MGGMGVYMYVKFSKAEDETCDAGNCADSIGLCSVKGQRKKATRELAPVHGSSLHVTLVEIEGERAGLGNKWRRKCLRHHGGPVNALEKRVCPDVGSAMAAAADER